MRGHVPLWSWQQRRRPFTIPIDPSPEIGDPPLLPSTSSKIKCPGCQRMVFRDAYYLLLHRQLCPSGIDCLSCKRCLSLFLNRKQLIQHKATCKYPLRRGGTRKTTDRRPQQQRKSSSSRYDPPSNLPELKRYICRREGCGKSFLSLKTLSQHIKRHKKPYQCSFSGCSKSFGSSWDRTIHERTHREEKKEKCTFCLSAFKDPAGLRHHMKRFHIGRVVERPFQCKMCKKQFRTRNDLQVHFTAHIPRLRRESKRCECGKYMNCSTEKCCGKDEVL